MTARTAQASDETAVRACLPVEIDHLTYWYPGHTAPVLDGMSLRVEQGQFVVLIGPSGCGKSTLALCLNGVIPQVLGGQIGGTVRVFGRDPMERPVFEMATLVGIVFQDPDSQLCTIHVRDEVAFGPQNLLVPREQVLARVARALSFVQLSAAGEVPVFALSGGQKQRVAIASVLSMEPDLIVLDEPTSNLDPAGAREVLAVVDRLRQERGTTVIVIEHDLSRLLAVCDRLVVMDRGQIVLDGRPREVLAEHGPWLRDGLGLRLPQTVEFALRARARGIGFARFPVAPGEVDVGLFPSVRPASRPAPTRPQSCAPGQTDRAIVMEDVGFRYDDGTVALREVSGEVHSGEILAVVGENGSGKSTLASLFVGLRRPSAGRLVVCGLDARKASPAELAKRVGYVFQYPEHQFVADRVDEEIAYGLRRRGLREQDVSTAVEEMLTVFGLSGVRDRHPLRLSMGQKRKLSVASMLVLKPEVLVLDEPTTGQDLRSTQGLMDLLQRLNQAGLTIVFITHDLHLAARHAHRILALRNGRVSFSGTPEELLCTLREGYPVGLDIPESYELFLRLQMAMGADVPFTVDGRELADLAVP